jgi:hypothetical protein
MMASGVMTSTFPGKAGKSEAPKSATFGASLTIRKVSDPLKQVDDEPEFLESHRLP